MVGLALTFGMFLHLHAFWWTGRGACNFIRIGLLMEQGILYLVRWMSLEIENAHSQSIFSRVEDHVSRTQGDKQSNRCRNDVLVAGTLSVNDIVRRK